jgi:hypothetical protein
MNTAPQPSELAGDKQIALTPKGSTLGPGGPTSLLRRALRFWPIIAGIGATLVVIGGALIAVGNFVGDIRVVKGNVMRHETTIQNLEQKQSDLGIKDTEIVSQIKMSLVTLSQEVSQVNISIKEISSRSSDLDNVWRTALNNIAALQAKAITFDTFVNSQTNWPTLLFDAQKSIADISQRINHIQEDLKASDKRLGTADTRASEVEQDLKRLRESITGLQTLNDKLPILESILKGVPKDKDAAMKALGQVGIVRHALIAYMEIETTKLVNTMLLSDPSEGAYAKLHDLEQLAHACDPLLVATATGDMTAPIFIVIRNIRDVVDRNRLEQKAGTEAMARLRGVDQHPSPRAYALAQILLARCDSFPSRREAKKHSERAKRAIAHAETALVVYNSSSSALNLKLINELNVLFNELDEGRRLEFLERFPALWRGFSKVQEYDESLVGRFRYLNNSAYYMSLALLYLSDLDQGRRLDLSAFEKSMEEPISKICGDILRFCDMALQISVHQSGAWDTKAEALTAVSEILGTPHIPESTRTNLAQALGLTGALPDAKAQLLREAVAAFQMSLAGRSGQRQAAQAGEKLAQDDFFIRWPESIREGVLTKVRAQRVVSALPITP